MKKSQAIIVFLVLFVLGILIGVFIPIGHKNNTHTAQLESNIASGEVSSQGGGGGSASGSVHLPNQNDLRQDAGYESRIQEEDVAVELRGSNQAMKIGNAPAIGEQNSVEESYPEVGTPTISMTNRGRINAAPSIGEQNAYDEGSGHQTVNPTLNRSNNQRSATASQNNSFGSTITIGSVSKPSRKTSEPSKFYSFRVSANSASGSSLSYLLCDPGSGVVSYTSSTGSFSNVAPTDDGSYILRVRSSDGGEIQQTVTGFDKVSKMSKSQLQAILNNPSAGETNKSLYFSFDTDKLRINCSGLNSDEAAPRSLSAIWNGVQLLDWEITVTAGPTYDKYNRIDSFSISVR